MNYDKETKVVIGICVVLLVAWAILTPIYTSKEKKKIKPESVSETIDSSKTPVADKENNETADEALVKKHTDAKPGVQKKAVVTIPKSIQKLPDVTLTNDTSVVVIDPNQGGLKSITLKTHFRSNSEKQNIVIDKGLQRDALSLAADAVWALVKIEESRQHGDDSYELRRLFTDAGGQEFVVIQSWKLDKNYQLLYDVEIVNKSSKELVMKRLTVNAGGIAPSKQLSGDNVRMEQHNVDYHLKDDKEVRSISAAGEKKEVKELGVVSWLSVSNKYFACMLFAQQPFVDGIIISREKRDKVGWEKEKIDEYVVASATGSLGTIRLQPGISGKWQFKYYAGPKELAQLQMLEPSAPTILRLGWSWLAPICKFLLKILIYFKDFTGSWGLSIILLTIVVKGLLWPLTHKANVSMKRMQKLQPLMKELREKYKDNQQMQSMKMMELYKEHKVNPLGGCLPILLQFPVFVALYFTFEGSVEMRQASFLWAKDLAQPDTIAVIANTVAINPLVIVWTGLLVVQQTMTPTAMDPMQQKMMVFMPVVMLIFLYNFPAGVTLYYTVSQIISLIQLFINKKLYKDDVIAQPAKA